MSRLESAVEENRPIIVFVLGDDDVSATMKALARDNMFCEILYNQRFVHIMLNHEHAVGKKFMEIYQNCVPPSFYVIGPTGIPWIAVSDLRKVLAERGKGKSIRAIYCYIQEQLKDHLNQGQGDDLFGDFDLTFPGWTPPITDDELSNIGFTPKPSTRTDVSPSTISYTKAVTMNVTPMTNNAALRSENGNTKRREKFVRFKIQVLETNQSTITFVKDENYFVAVVKIIQETFKIESFKLFTGFPRRELTARDCNMLIKDIFTGTSAVIYVQPIAKRETYNFYQLMAQCMHSVGQSVSSVITSGLRQFVVAVTWIFPQRMQQVLRNRFLTQPLEHTQEQVFFSIDNDTAIPTNSSAGTANEIDFQEEKESDSKERKCREKED